MYFVGSPIVPQNNVAKLSGSKAENFQVVKMTNGSSDSPPITQHDNKCSIDTPEESAKERSTAQVAPSGGVDSTLRHQEEPTKSGEEEEVVEEEGPAKGRCDVSDGMHQATDSGTASVTNSPRTVHTEMVVMSAESSVSSDSVLSVQTLDTGSGVVSSSGGNAEEKPLLSPVRDRNIFSSIREKLRDSFKDQIPKAGENADRCKSSPVENNILKVTADGRPSAGTACPAVSGSKLATQPQMPASKGDKGNLFDKLSDLTVGGPCLDYLDATGSAKPPGKYMQHNLLMRLRILNPRTVGRFQAFLVFLPFGACSYFFLEIPTFWPKTPANIANLYSKFVSSSEMKDLIFL